MTGPAARVRPVRLPSPEVTPAALGQGAVLAVVPVRDGALPAGAAEAVAEAGGVVLVVGAGAGEAAVSLGAVTAWAADPGPWAPARWAVAVAPLVAGYRCILLPASADGRDLAPRLAWETDRVLHAGAVAVGADAVVVARRGGLVTEVHRIDGPCVATLIPGVRGVGSPAPSGAPPIAVPLGAAAADAPADAVVVEVLPADPATVDLAEATRVVVGGAGLGDPTGFDTLAAVAAGLGASPGATRVVADAGWVAHDRYIGTTGVSIDPDLYVSFGVSGAVQHVTGIGRPDHIVAVNTDASAPIMGMADLALVTDGRALLEELAGRLATVAGAS